MDHEPNLIVIEEHLVHPENSPRPTTEDIEVYRWYGDRLKEEFLVVKTD